MVASNIDLPSYHDLSPNMGMEITYHYAFLHDSSDYANKMLYRYLGIQNLL